MRLSQKLIYTFLLIFLFSNLNAFNSQDIQLKNGNADMHSLNFKDSEIYSVSGEWNFWWNRLIPPEAFLQGNIVAPDLVTRLPGSWTNIELDDKKLPPIGCATYQMQLTMPDDIEYGLFLYQMVSSYTLYINGEKIATNGTVASDAMNTKPEYRAQTVYFKPINGKADFVLHISNKDYRYAGQWKPLLIGYPAVVNRESDRNLIVEMFLFGAIMIIGLYNIALFTFRRKDRSPLWFALFCLVIAGRLVATGHTAVAIFFANFPWELQVKLELSIFSLGALFSICFIRNLFPEEFPKIPFILLTVIYSVFTLLSFVTPVSFFNTLVTPLEFFGMLGLLVILVVLAVAVFRKRKSALLFILGYLILALTGINDLLYSKLIVNIAYLFPFGLFLFIFIQAVVLARMYSHSFFQVEQLSESLVKTNVSLEEKNNQLEDLTLHLEDKVSERTKELLNAYDEIKSLALIDSMTGLANRRKILSLIEFEEKRNYREGLQFVLAMIDVDDFKNINDTYGHEAGDTVLQKMATTLVETIRQQDQACRWGGEEFLVLFSATTMESISIVAEKIRMSIEALVVQYNGIDLHITVTIGLAISNSGESFYECIKRADESLYRGKNEGKNRVFYTDFVLARNNV